MALREPLLAFWRAWGELNPVCMETRWGQIVTDARFPRVWESNRAAVLRRHDRAPATEIRQVLLPALRAAGAEFETVELWDPPAWCPALEELAVGAEEVGRDVVMVFRGRAAEPAPIGSAVEVREIREPGRGFWKVYRDSRNEFGDQMSRETLRQLVRRDREVLVPAGLRLFGGFVEGELAGFASLISLRRVGYVDNVVTLPAFRRRGVASAITVRAVRASRDAGDRAVNLLAEEGSGPQRLYQRLGFRVEASVVTVTNKLGRG